MHFSGIFISNLLMRIQGFRNLDFDLKRRTKNTTIFHFSACYGCCICAVIIVELSCFDILKVGFHWSGMRFKNFIGFW